MKYLIIGANAAGMSAAVRIAKFDKSARITVLEKSDVVSFGSCGIPYFLAGEFTDIGTMTARTLQEFIDSGINIHLFHTAIRLDSSQKTVVTQDTRSNQHIEFTYDRLMIATGASPICLPIQGAGSQNVYTMHTRADAIALQQKLPNVHNIVIIGAGYIGLEAAEAFQSLGKHVTVIEQAPHILARTFDVQMTQLLEQELITQGINLRLCESVTGLQSKQTHVSAVITNKNTYDADLVIMATGFKPNMAFLKESGIELSPQGAIIVDNQGKTNIPDIFSAGDCATIKHRITGNSYIPLATTQPTNWAESLGKL